ncbi:MAG TPA: hypothetical protein VHJ20_07840 [Polyangia bacterium]|nr:hypothetical protein [Polyangia bacterium]
MRTRALAFALGFVALVAAACGRPLVGATSNDDAGAPSAAATGCMLGVSPVATSTLCASHPELCGTVCGDACVDLRRDADHCGRCDRACAARAACNDGACGVEPTVVVAPTPGCASMRLAYEDGAIYYSDLGHGTINRVPTSGGAPTVLASDVIPATIHTSSAQPLFPNGGPVGTNILVRDGTVYWIGAADRPSVDATGMAHGGVGTAIWSVRAGSAPVLVLPYAYVPGPSPVSSVGVNGAAPLEDPNERPPLSAMTLSPDGATLFFAAGSRIYRIPATVTAPPHGVELVGFTAGPETGFATALATDGDRLFFPSSDGTGIEMFDLTTPCTPMTGPPATGAGGRASSYTCPSFVFGSFPIALLDTITISNGFVTWAKENNVWRADLSQHDPSIDGHAIFSDTVSGFGVTGFAVGKTNAFYGEDTTVEMGSSVSVETGNPPPGRVLARAQPWPSSFVLDDARVYWTTANCDVSAIAATPQ